MKFQGLEVIWARTFAPKAWRWWCQGLREVSIHGSTPPRSAQERAAPRCRSTCRPARGRPTGSRTFRSEGLPPGCSRPLRRRPDAMPRLNAQLCSRSMLKAVISWRTYRRRGRRSRRGSGRREEVRLPCGTPRQPRKSGPASMVNPGVPDSMSTAPMPLCPGRPSNRVNTA